MTLRVGLLHYTSPPVVGGVEIVLAHHARLMAAAGHRVRIIAGRGSAPDPSVELVRLPLADGRHPRLRSIRAALDAGQVPDGWDSLVDELAAQLRGALDGLDIVLAHNVCSMPLNLALTSALRRVTAEAGAPALVAWQHDIAATSSRYADVLHDGPPWDELYAPWPGTRYVAISESRRLELAEAIGVDPGEVTVIPNGLDVDAFLGLHAVTRRILAPLRLGGADPIVLIPARITPRKNLELGVRVLAELRRDGDARLIITGPTDPHDPLAGAYLQTLRALARTLGVADAVHFLAADRGRQTPPRVVADLYRVADVLFLPSTDEGFGLPILEAAVCRLPIVCADIAPLRDLAGEGAGFIDPGAGPEAAARVIREQVLGTAVTRLAARVRTAYGWSAIYDQWIAPLLDEVMDGRRAAAGSDGA